MACASSQLCPDLDTNEFPSPWDFPSERFKGSWGGRGHRKPAFETEARKATWSCHWYEREPSAYGTVFLGFRDPEFRWQMSPLLKDEGLITHPHIWNRQYTMDPVKGPAVQIPTSKWERQEL